MSSSVNDRTPVIVTMYSNLREAGFRVDTAAGVMFRGLSAPACLLSPQESPSEMSLRVTIRLDVRAL